MSNNKKLKKLFNESDKCRRCGKFKFEEGYDLDITLYCGGCNRLDNIEKLQTYNFKYNQLFYPNLDHSKIIQKLDGYVKNKYSMCCDLLYDGKHIKIMNGCITDIKDYYSYKLGILKQYLFIGIETGKYKRFETFYNKKNKNLIIV